MAAILFVRIQSNLDPHELDRRIEERRTRFLEVPGLISKYIYPRYKAAGGTCGIYFFESKASLAAFRETELAKSIPAAYEATDIRREIYEVLFSLRPEQGPLPE